jgi:DNA-binding response OmpR family regulator
MSNGKTDQPRILTVDDDPRICRLIARYLEREGFEVRAATNGEEMRARMAEAPVDLIIMDLLLPGEDGLSLTRELRRESNVAIIILTGKGETVDRIVGLEVGADDYLGKPFDERELLARVRSVLRRSAAGAPRTDDRAGLAFEGWQLDLDAHELTAPDGDRVVLTTAEFRLLSGLAQNAKRVLNRDQLLDLVAAREWDPYDRSIDVLIGKLRRKLEEDPKRPTLIKTVRGVGYMFACDVEGT